MTYLIFRRYRFQYFGALVSSLGPRSKICSDHTNPDFRYRIRIIILRLNFLKVFCQIFYADWRCIFLKTISQKFIFNCYQISPNKSTLPRYSKYIQYSAIIRGQIVGQLVAQYSTRPSVAIYTSLYICVIFLYTINVHSVK